MIGQPRELAPRDKRPSVAVIGAGPAGLSAAYALACSGVGVHVFEGSQVVGGLARTLPLWGQRVDLGPHRFHSSDRRVQALWDRLVGPDWAQVHASPGILRDEHTLQYPLRLGDVIARVGMAESLRCALDHGWGRLGPRGEPRTFEEWLVQRFGRRVFENFFRAYNEKLFGRRCSEIDAAVAAAASKDRSFIETVLGAAGLDRILRSGTTVRQITHDFRYPNEGSGVVYERMAQQISSLGGSLHFGAKVDGLLVERDRVRGIRVDASEVAFDDVVSTIPLVPLVEQLPALSGTVRSALDHARDALRFRSALLLYVEVQASALFPQSWLEVHSGRVRCGRITNFRNWVPGLYAGSDATVLCLEYWCDLNDDTWRLSDLELGALGAAELDSLGLLRHAPVARTHVVRIPRCFPVYGVGYRDVLAPLIEHLETYRGLHSIGRGGRFSLGSQDTHWTTGLEAADSVLASHGLPNVV